MVEMGKKIRSSLQTFGHYLEFFLMLTQHERGPHPELDHQLLKTQKWISARLEVMIGINWIKERTGLNFSHLMMNQRAQGMRSLTWLPVHGVTMMNHQR